MKKLLSILLALILCVGTLVSCGNEETSSSESEQESEKGQVSLLTSPPNDEVVSTYYQIKSGISYKGEEMREKGEYPNDYVYGTYFKIIDTYDEFVASISKGDDIDESFFEKNFIYVICKHESDVTSDSDERHLGYRNFYIENGTAHLTVDKAVSDAFDDAWTTWMRTTTYTYIIIPKEALGGVDADSVTSFVLDKDKITYYYSDMNSTNDFIGVYEDGDTWILNDSNAYEAFKEDVYPISAKYGLKFTFDERLYLVVYREKHPQMSEYGYFDFSMGTDELKLTARYRFTQELDSETVNAGFDLIVIPRSALEIDPSTVQCERATIDFERTSRFE